MSSQAARSLAKTNEQKTPQLSQFSMTAAAAEATKEAAAKIKDARLRDYRQALLEYVYGKAYSYQL